MISLPLFALSVVCYAIKELALHGKLKWSGDPVGFWGSDSSIRKYKYIKGVIQPAPNKWYYRWFKISYKERYPLSATLFVMFTDGMHMSQTAFKIFLTLSIVFYSPVFGAWLSDALLYFAIFGVGFSLAYKVFSK